MTPPQENQSDQSSREDEVHSGYDLESGVLARVREWTDVFAWLRLGKTLRVVGSPPLLILVAVTYAIWSIGAPRISGIENVHSDSLTIRYAGQSEMELHSIAWVVGQRISQSTVVTMLSPNSADSANEASPGFWRKVAAVVWSLLVWMPAALLLLRQGALLTADRPMVGFVDGIKTAGRRAPLACLMAFVPLACVVVIGFALVVTTWVSRIGVWAESPLGLVAALIAVVCGVLAFGSYFAVPIGWAALVNEKEPDVLDSLSRGYEYLYRRPLQLAMYACISIVILLVAVFFAEGVSLAASKVASSMMAIAGASDSMLDSTKENLRLLPTIVAMTLFWSLLGGVYLLLRRDAGGQEIEDIWQPAPESTKPLPKLPKSN